MPHILEVYRELLSERKMLKKKLTKKKILFLKLKREIEHHDEAQLFLSHLEKTAHEKVVEKIENLVTLCLQSVYEKNLQFKLIFEEKRNSIEARPVIIQDGHEFDPKEDKGGGMSDLISIALRIILWNPKKPESRRLFILDEPFKRAGAFCLMIGRLIKYLSKKLKIQFIIFTHEDDLAAICGRIYRISNDGEQSKARLIKGLKRR